VGGVADHSGRGCGVSAGQKRLLALAAAAVGVVLIAIAFVYWAEPARSLPSFFPGHEAGSGHHHVKHGIASFLVGLALLVYAWFQTGTKARSAGA
jgi:hypothetical protein